MIPDTNLDSHTLSRRQQPNQPLNLRGGGGGGHDEPTPRILLIGSTRNTRKLLCANGKWSPKTICCCSLPSWPHGTTHTWARLGDLFAIVWLVYVLQQTLLAEHLLNGNNDGRGQSWNCSKWAAEYGSSGLGTPNGESLELDRVKSGTISSKFTILEYLESAKYLRHQE